MAIVVIGENERRAEGSAPTDGEGYDAATLELTGLQEELVKAVHGTGTPTVVVLINGRPLAVRWIAQHVPAILEAWLPGEKGGQAVAEILFGEINPSGKLVGDGSPARRPTAGLLQLQEVQASLVKRGWGRAYVDLEPTPLYPFGFGLSYTPFEYSGLRLEPGRSLRPRVLRSSVQVKNIGDRPGNETVQLYLEDLVSSVATPVKQLRGFTKVRSTPGETKTCTFKLTPDDLALLDRT